MPHVSLISFMSRKTSAGTVRCMESTCYYYISFRSPDDTWTGPVNLGEAVNSPAGAEFSPYVSPDGHYFFFMAVRPRPQTEIPDSLTLDFLRRYRAEPGSGNPAIYWMDAAFLDRLKPGAGG